MTKIIKHMVIPIFIIGISFVLFTSCKNSDDDYNPSATDNSLPSDASTDAQYVQAYKDAGYSTFKNTCAEASSGYKLSYLFLKQSADASYDYEGAQVSFTKTDCDATVTHSLAVQENIFYVKLTTDTSADYYKPASAAVGKGMNLYVTDVKITPNSPAIVTKFKATANKDPYSYTAYLATSYTGTTGSIPFSYTSYSATGFCGTTDWSLGVTKDVYLPGDSTADAGTNTRDAGLLADGGLTDCALPPRGDAKFYFDVGGAGGSAGVGGTAANGISGSDGTADIYNAQLYLRFGIALSNDSSADEVNTIWLTETQSNTGVESVPSSLYGGLAGAIDNVFTASGFIPAETAFYASKNNNYPWDFVTTGSGPFYKED
jgi:hypothetical protein